MNIYLASLAFVVLAEMGDKTQLATVALAARYERIIPIWLGTTTGMLVADAIGIIVGIVLGKKIPERFIKWFAALIFVAFGIIGLCENLPVSIVVPILVITVAALAVFALRSRAGGPETGD
jgi:putative Ca2+/H+ antiporter (TMEM165/GDT1 family)